MTITEAIGAAGWGVAEEIRKVRIRPGLMRVVGLTALLLLPLTACTPDDGGGGGAGAAGLAGVDLAEHEVVYTSLAGDEDADLWLVKADGTDPVQLTDDPGLEFMAAWSPDGDRVAYAAGATANGPADLFVLDLDGGEPQQVTSTPDRCETAPTWTPDGEELVYASSDCDGERRASSRPVSTAGRSAHWSRLVPGPTSGRTDGCSTRRRFPASPGTSSGCG